MNVPIELCHHCQKIRPTPPKNIEKYKKNMLQRIVTSDAATPATINTIPQTINVIHSFENMFFISEKFTSQPTSIPHMIRNNASA